ncbi:PREDICTED: NKG2-D type II integral membrane protein isoform X1 [Dipodomys ordii]|uniref:NKG2-D type II integral membrane protein n=1 Tax=Dipodomys ordii TaxID=10020 RepID=A0A1S3GSN2_DIPOR|nr:PREDICTED: NKG2-D type II integral membrane protein isoform X1 [Dipodomys ordii]
MFAGRLESHLHVSDGPVRGPQDHHLAPLFLVRLIAVAMAIRFMVMVAIWTTVFILASPHQEVSAPFTEAGGAPCPEDWVYYGHTCYYFSKERKTWHQSRAACLSQNSSLLRVHSRERQDFLRLIKSYHWLGLVRIPGSESWRWDDGSALQPHQLTVLDMQNGTCSVYSASFKAYAESCLASNTFICMREAV